MGLPALSALLLAALGAAHAIAPLGLSPLSPLMMPMGGISPYGKMGMMGGYGMQQQGPRMRPEILTCIAKDAQDPTSQIRLTLTNSRMRGPAPSMGGFGGFGGYDDDEWDDGYDDGYYGGFGGGYSMGGGMGGPGMMGQGHPGQSDDQPAEFRLDGTVVPGAGMNKAGTYAVVITQYGRVADGCSAQSLGPVLHSQNLGNGMSGMGGHPGMGMPGMMGAGFGVPGFGMGGLGHPGAMMGPYSSPYAGNFYGQRRGGVLGQLSNPAIVGPSATVYSAHVNGISKNDLLGRGVALCRAVDNGRCRGYIPFCCTIQRDSLSAMELFVQRPDDYDDDGFGGPIGGIGGGIGGPIGGGAIGGGAIGGGVIGGGDGGIF